MNDERSPMDESAQEDEDCWSHGKRQSQSLSPHSKINASTTKDSVEYTSRGD